MLGAVIIPALILVDRADETMTLLPNDTLVPYTSRLPPDTLYVPVLLPVSFVRFSAYPADPRTLIPPLLIKYAVPPSGTERVVGPLLSYISTPAAAEDELIVLLVPRLTVKELFDTPYRSIVPPSPVVLIVTLLATSIVAAPLPCIWNHICAPLPVLFIV